MEVSGRRVADSEEMANMCDTCERTRSVSRSAFGYCIECREYLCDDCYQGHRDPKPCSNHKLLEGKQVPKERLRPVDICRMHTDEKIKYFCKGHSALACQKCAFLVHRMCTDAIDISTMSNNPETNQRYQEIRKQIVTLETKTNKIRQIRLNNVSKIDSNKKQAKADIKQFCKEMHEYLNKIEEATHEEVDQIEADDILRMDTILQDCDSVNADLTVVSTDLETNQDPNRKDQLFIAVKKAAVTIETLEDKLKIASTNNTVRDYAFEPYDLLKSLMTDLDKLGQVSIRSEAVIDSSPSSKLNVKSPRNLDNVSVDTDDGINVRTASDMKTCRITGSTILEGDTTLAIVDRNNDSVKIVDIEKKTIESKICLSDFPWDITLVKPAELAVTLPKANKVQFLSVTGTSLSLGCQMKVSGECRGIVHDNDRFFISFSDPEQVQILNHVGIVLTTMSAKTDKQIHFSCPFYLTLSVDRSMLYVSDYYTHNVYCLDMNGGVKATYMDKGLYMPRGIAATEDGLLFVCGQVSHNVFLISSDCRRGRELVDGSRGVHYPNSVTYNSALSTFYVGQEDNDTLNVFKLN